MDVLHEGWPTLYLAGDDGIEIRREIEHHGTVRTFRGGGGK
jgi:hypothetical protein